MYRKNPLTNILEIDAEILKNLDIKSLNRYCRSTNYKASVCNDYNFWMDKIKYDKLPYYLIKKVPQTYDDWLNLYRILKITSDSATQTLLVNSIEATRSDNNTNGIINVYRIKPIILKNIFSQLDADLLNIRITYINDNLYYLMVIGQVIHINYNDVLDIITNVYYIMYSNNENNSNIVDERFLSFIINIMSIQMFIRDIPGFNPIHLYRRLSILDTIKYLKI